MVTQKIGRYEIRGVIGSGGMATVYRGFDPHFEREVAIKVLPPALLHDSSFLTRFQREAKIIATLEHSAIVPVHDYGEDNGQPYFVMRMMSGGSLADRLINGSLSIGETARVLERVAQALDDAHKQGIVHRDLKPGNILFDHLGDAYLSDFGIAKLVQTSTTLTRSNTIVGTPAYMSPEQGRGEKDIDGRSDIYSMGAIIFEMLSGKVPYEADTPTGQIIKHITDPIPDILNLRSDLPPGIRAVINKAMAKNREDRYATALEVIRALKAVAAGETPVISKIHEQETQMSEPVVIPARRSIPIWYWIAGVFALAVILLGGSFALGAFSPSTTSTQTPTVALTTVPVPSVTLLPSQTHTLRPTLTRTPQPSFTSTNLTLKTSTLLPRVTVNVDAANIRSGPGTNYVILDTVPRGAALDVLGRNQEGNWLVVSVPGSGRVGWIAVSTVTYPFSVAEIAISTAPPSPTPRPVQATPTPTRTRAALTSTPTSVLVITATATIEYFTPTYTVEPSNTPTVYPTPYP
jgi:serine/threonine-protein kinase